MGEVDPAFIQAIEHRPKLKFIEAEAIPVINLSVSSLSDTKEVVSQIGNACKKWGFFQVINHGVPLDLREKIEKVMKQFYDQSLEEKNKVKKDEDKAMGYHDGELTKNVRDWKEVFDFLLHNPTVMPASHELYDQELLTWTNQWPQKVCEEYAKEVEKLAYKLLELISLSLGLSANRLNDYFKDQNSFVRLNHYPTCPFPDLALGVGRHKDGGALTVLSQDDIGGLEVKRKSDGEWIQVKPTPNAYIINLGDVLQVWSNDMYESVEHRVAVNSKKGRFSIPFFFLPSHYVTVKPLDELVNEQNTPKYKEYNWGKYLANRKSSNYKKLGVENIQIDHFRV
ncbi:2OG-FeII_Oxy domain-containing protein/DIOX_N domain-containing protein [Cephalotus follicularis]|uniref:2OG-FeII_Oxy domain-containing protein/DIOX_N domain-containing protein n=1 Tax=Cephalotus follicularis TaxID=3775 RepID=A0A1Q3CMN4_CEPFO|nr:2OG-FeII_Oxy domain-containing protein/DIOX_N domain-containing protein [Cephalotus follicularis]